jgi:hypothetical protein
MHHGNLLLDVNTSIPSVSPLLAHHVRGLYVRLRDTLIGSSRPPHVFTMVINYYEPSIMVWNGDNLTLTYKVVNVIYR